MNLPSTMKRTPSCAASRLAASHLTALSLAVALLFNASPAQAGPLASDLGISYLGAWAGSTPFATGSLTGFVEWAVYGPGAFPYGAGGYTPTGGQLTYAYQVYVTGTAPVSHFDVDLPNPGNNIGSFTSFGVASPTASSIGAVAAWDFAGVGTGSNTIGLAYSSDRIPQDWFGSVIDTGQSTFVVPIPAPSSITIPEPAAVTLLCLGTVLLLPGVVRRCLRR